MDMHPEREWIAARLDALTPAWEPDLVRGRARLAAQAPAPRRAWRYALATAAAAVVIAAIAPSGRALAQDLWYRWFVTRVAVVRVDLSKVPLDTSIRSDGAEQAADSIEEASRLAGYTVELPPADVLAGTPVLNVLHPVEVRQTIHTKALMDALASAGADDIEVPAEWDGITVRAILGRTVVARYLGATDVGRHPDDVTIIQTPAIRLEMPAGLELDRLAEAVFRAAGVPWAEARQLGEEYAANPAWLLDAPEKGPVTVETVPLAGGTAVVIEDANEGETMVLVSRPWRIYAVSSLSREKSLQVASALR